METNSVANAFEGYGRAKRSVIVLEGKGIMRVLVLSNELGKAMMRAAARGRAQLWFMGERKRKRLCSSSCLFQLRQFEPHRELLSIEQTGKRQF